MPTLSPKDHDYQYEVPQIEQIKQLFSATKNWQDKYRQLMLLGKQAPKLSPEYKVEAAQIDGCESNTWLYHKVIEDKHYFIADSDARIVKGLMMILLSVFHNQDKSPEINIEQLFTELGLFTQLSPSRTNGLTAMAKAMISVF